MTVFTGLLPQRSLPPDRVAWRGGRGGRGVALCYKARKVPGHSARPNRVTSTRRIWLLKAWPGPACKLARAGISIFQPVPYSHPTAYSLAGHGWQIASDEQPTPTCSDPPANATSPRSRRTRRHPTKNVCAWLPSYDIENISSTAKQPPVEVASCAALSGSLESDYVERAAAAFEDAMPPPRCGAVAADWRKNHSHRR